ncbi:DUF6583 family protein [Pontibacillus sp. HMF3514]|uniref:DUF6583 family protein n=1 Tax=Pontibacillus sp. HMF3514 TaxID=2692425 RepID=UPI00131FEFEC|nr:DUF6583 family protein [Pontibacillus sp. HMF3514]QHE51220.1 hypothetical protein GS400_03880 [Pontibacillus sp. HMF3514]
MSQNQTGAKKKGMNKWLITAIVVVIVAGFGATAYGVLKENNPMAMYLLAEKNTMEDQWDRLEKYNFGSLELQDRMLEEAYQSKQTLSMNLNVEGEQVNQQFPQLMFIQGLLSTAKIEMNTKINPNTEETYNSVDLLLQGSSMANVQIYQNVKNFSIQAPFVYDKYFTIANDQVGAYLEKMGEPSNGITEIPNIAKYNQASFTSEEMKEITSDYMRTLGQQLKEEQFSLQKNVAYQDKQYDKVTVQISEQEARDMIRTLLIKLREDNRIWSVVNTQMQLQGGQQSMDEDTMKEDIDEAIEGLDQIKLPEGIQIEAYIKDDLVAHEKWTLPIEDTNGKQVDITVSSDYLKQTQENYLSKVTVDVNPVAEDQLFQFSYKENGKSTKDGLHVDYMIDINFKGKTDDFHGNLALGTDYKENSSKTEFDLTVEGSDPSLQEFPKVTGFFNTATKEESQNQLKRNIDLGLDITMNNSMVGNTKGHVEFHIKQNYAFNNEMKFPEMNNQNSVNIMELSKVEMEQIGLEIQQNLQKYIGSFTGGFGGF